MPTADRYRFLEIAVFNLQKIKKLPGETVWRDVASPLGPLTVLAADAGVRAIAFAGEQTERAKIDFPRARARVAIDKAVAQLTRYFEGTLRNFDLPLDLHGTDFQQRVWELVLKIPFGQTRTYGELARALGNAGASQAVGAANGKNPIAIAVPCHRVIGASGNLTGYAGGLEKKGVLLTHEGAIQPALFGT